MKTGWQMEWENEVRYFAPLRADLNTRMRVFSEAFEPLRQLGQQFGISVREATRSLRQFNEQLELYHKR